VLAAGQYSMERSASVGNLVARTIQISGGKHGTKPGQASGDSGSCSRTSTVLYLPKSTSIIPHPRFLYRQHEYDMTIVCSIDVLKFGSRSHKGMPVPIRSIQYCRFMLATRNVASPIRPCQFFRSCCMHLFQSRFTHLTYSAVPTDALYQCPTVSTIQCFSPGEGSKMGEKEKSRNKARL